MFEIPVTKPTGRYSTIAPACVIAIGRFTAGVGARPWEVGGGIKSPLRTTGFPARFLIARRIGDYGSPNSIHTDSPMNKMLYAVVASVVFLTGSVRSAEPPVKDTDNGLPDLAAELKKTPGCLGVETARTASGKTVIFAWFENKKAALKWYYSDTHVALMKQFFPERKGRKPLADVPDDSGPIMAIASITLTEKPTKENPLPYKQIAIEIYQPLGGGISIGGKFSPEKMVIPERNDKPTKK